MLILLNKATRLSDVFIGLPKKYTADIKFGVITDTLDSGGQVIHLEEVKGLERARIQKVIKRFTGNIEQAVPMYSAVKHQGKPLYRFARMGVKIEKPPRKVDISSLEIINIKEDLLTVEVSCSSGTYIRTLAHDIGKAYGTGAVLAGLRRTAINGFDVDDSAGIENIIGLSARDTIQEKSRWIISLHRLLKDALSLYIKERYIRPVRNGSRICKEMLLGESLVPGKAEVRVHYLKDLAAVKSEDGRIIAIHRIIENISEFDKLVPDKVFTKNVVIF